MRSDTELLDALQELVDNTGKDDPHRNITCRWSTTGRGWRLHETTRAGFKSVRTAIDHFLKTHTSFGGSSDG